MGVQGVALNGIFSTPFYRSLDVAFGDTRCKGKMFPGTS